MKNNHYTQTEIENLSAYLDHELSQTEEAQLRSRLAQDNKLREALEDLRLTRYTLRNTPKVRRQRSFVLTPEMVRQQKSAWRIFNFSRTIAVAASVLFALVIGGQLLSGFGGRGMLAAAPQSEVAMNTAADEAAEEPMMMEAPAEENAADDSVMSALADETEADQAMDTEMAEPAAEMMPMPTQTLPPSPTQGEGELTPGLPSGGGGLPPTETAPEEAPAPTEAASAEFTGKDAGAGDSSLRITGEQPTDEIAGMENTSPKTPPVAESSIQPIRWVQGGLLLVALLAAGLAIFYRWRVL
ncbi:MAG: hypothetical protein P8046_04375 [Anaerolineales bacterium]